MTTPRVSWLLLVLLAVGQVAGQVPDVGPYAQVKIPDLAVPAPTRTNRVTAAVVIFPDSAAPGEFVTLVVKVRVAAGHYIYALDKSGTMNLPTTLETELGGVLRPVGPWRGPEPKVKDDGSRTFTGEVVFQRQFLVEREPATNSWKAPIQLKYQVCNEALCWPPATLALETVLKVRPR